MRPPCPACGGGLGRGLRPIGEGEGARQNGSGNKNRRPLEPAGAFIQQTFIDSAEDRDCTHGAFIVIRGRMPGMRDPRGLGSEIYGGFQ
jgi:hypothetical protein